MENSKVSREKEAAALREWFSTQKKYGSWAAMERALKITKDYLRHIKSGEKRAVDPQLRRKLYEATGLDIFKPISNDLKVRKQFSRRQEDSVQASKNALSASERAAKIRELLVTLADELEFFKQQPEQARKIFRKTVPGEDVGYITTLLRALYDEDQFQRWLLFSNYKLKSKEES
ncbi:MAG: hypothetical protein ACPLYF_04075 [Fervidobacterium sp.]